MRRSRKDGKDPVDDKVFYNTTDLNTDVTMDNNPSYDITKCSSTVDSSYSTIKPGHSDVVMTTNPSYEIPDKPCEDEYNYVQIDEFKQHSNLDERIKMDSNPSYGVNTVDNRAIPFSTTNDIKAHRSSHDTTTEQHDYSIAANATGVATENNITADEQSDDPYYI